MASLQFWEGIFWYAPVLACLLVLGGIVLWKIWENKNAHLPPAPPGWRPLLGHLPILGALPHQDLAELARKHGPKLMSLRFGSVLTIVASTPESAQLILQTHDQFFASRPQTAGNIHLGWNCSSIAGSPPSSHWHRMRRICSTDLFTNKRIHSFQSIRRKGVQSLLRAALAQRGQAMQLRPKMLASSLDTVARMTIGRPLSEVSPQATGLITELLHLLGVFNVGDFIPWLACLDLQGYERRMRLVGQQWGSLLQELLDLRRAAMERKRAGDGNAEGIQAPFAEMDFLNSLLSLSDLADDNIKAVLGDMFIGGTETSSITIEWALAELMATPNVMGALQDELDKVVGRERLVQEEDLGGLSYLHAIVKETMRLHPPAPFLIPREAMQVRDVYGYVIPPKTRVLVNVWAIGRNPNVWDNPLQFQPERFMQVGKYHHMNVHGQHFELLPFGSGKRKCPALSLGLMTVHLVLASLIQAFDWTLPPSTDVDFSEKFGLSLRMATPLSIIPTPRLEASLYL